MIQKECPYIDHKEITKICLVQEETEMIQKVCPYIDHKEITKICLVQEETEMRQKEPPYIDHKEMHQHQREPNQRYIREVVYAGVDR